MGKLSSETKTGLKSPLNRPRSQPTLSVELRRLHRDPLAVQWTLAVPRVDAPVRCVAPVAFGYAAMRFSLQHLEAWATVAFRTFRKLGRVRRVLRFGCAVDFRIEVKVHERSPARIDSDSLLTSYGL